MNTYRIITTDLVVSTIKAYTAREAVSKAVTLGYLVAKCTQIN